MRRCRNEVALDTNAYSDFMRGVPERVRVVRIHVPLIVLGELRAGFAAGGPCWRSSTLMSRSRAAKHSFGERATILFL